MGQTEFLGMLILAIITLGSLFALFIKCVKPINDLNINIVKLTSAIEKLTEDYKNHEMRITTHGKDIDDIKLKQENHEQRISALEKSN